MPQLLVNIALPVPLMQTFTYTVPPQFAGRVKRGSFVLVPFGSKRLSGIIVDFPATSPFATLKPILDVLDEEILSEELLKVAQWLADYYCAPLGETLRAFLPQGVGQTSKKIVALAREISKDELVTLPSQRKKILSAFGDVSSLTYSQLQKKTGIKYLYASINELASLGYLRITEENTSKKSKVKLERFIQKNELPELNQLKGKAQQKVLEILRILPDELVAVTTFLKETKTTLSTLKSLAQKNIITFIEKEVERKTEYAIDEQTAQSRFHILNEHQQRALDAITTATSSNQNKTFLLHGITGSGKTQVYIEAIRAVLAENKTAIVLVPEISLTPQTVRRFRAHFADGVIVMHSRMSAGERYDAWRLARAGKYKIAIGPRSALFAPLKNLGLIIVDEEHESSYKQFDATPRYHARDVAVLRGAFANAVVVLGSATPSIETYYNAQIGKYSLLELPERIDTAVLPSIRIVSMSDEHKRKYAAAKVRAKEIGKRAFEEGFNGISKLLEDKIRERLEKKEGIILLQNRRGFAPFIECNECGYVERCDRCEVTMTYHLAKKHLRCHYCGKVKPPPDVCPQCKGIQLKLHGFGTQRVEQDLQTLFPSAKILRMDMDTTTRKGSHDKLLKQFGSGDADILLGTQMVAKGLDFPRVTLVGVISADTQMMLPDFRSAERTFQLLTQVAGRAGRSTLKGEVIIQTYQPTHYTLKHVVDHNYVEFYKEEIQNRRSILYPPFSRVVLIEFKGPNETKIKKAAEQFVGRLKSYYESALVLGPTAAVISKIKNNFRYQALVKADKEKDKNGTVVRHAVMRVVQEMVSVSGKRSGVKIIVDVDPQGTM